MAEGTGLGIFVAKNLLKFHKGDLSIDSKIGEGTTVTLKLPIITEPEPKEEYLI